MVWKSAKLLKSGDKSIGKKRRLQGFSIRWRKIVVHLPGLSVIIIKVKKTDQSFTTSINYSFYYKFL